MAATKKIGRKSASGSGNWGRPNERTIIARYQAFPTTARPAVASDTERAAQRLAAMDRDRDRDGAGIEDDQAMNKEPAPVDAGDVAGDEDEPADNSEEAEGSRGRRCRPAEGVGHASLLEVLGWRGARDVEDDPQPRHKDAGAPGSAGSGVAQQVAEELDHLVRVALPEPGRDRGEAGRGRPARGTRPAGCRPRRSTTVFARAICPDRPTVRALGPGSAWRPRSPGQPRRGR